MIWEEISVKRGTKLKLINGIMHSKVYLQILIRHALLEGKRHIGRGFIFQEDNDPKYGSNLCQNYLTKKENSGNCFCVFVFNSLYLTVSMINYRGKGSNGLATLESRSESHLKEFGVVSIKN